MICGSSILNYFSNMNIIVNKEKHQYLRIFGLLVAIKNKTHCPTELEYYITFEIDMSPFNSVR